MKYKYKKNWLWVTIIFIAAITCIGVVAVMCNQFFISETTLKKINRKVSFSQFIYKDNDTNTIKLKESSNSEKYIKEIHNLFNKSISLHKISLDKVNIVMPSTYFSVCFGGESEYIFSRDGTIVVKLLKSIAEKSNFFAKLMFPFNKDRYINYQGRFKGYKQIPRQIIEILNKSIIYSNKKEMHKSISMLTSLKRAFGSKDERKASHLIRHKMIGYGYQTWIQKFTYTPTLGGYYSNKEEKARLEAKLLKVFPPQNSQNVISIKKANTRSKGIIILCAHYDCSSQNGSTGAIDNGSGVSAIIEIAKCLKDIWSNYELRFVFFGGEEAFLRGSKYYVEHLSDRDTNNITAVINLDTIGSKSDDRFAMVTFDGKENKASNILKKFAKKAGIKVEKGPTSDYKAFRKKNIPALCIGQIPTNMSNMRSELYIDSSKDTIDKVDTNKIKFISDMVISSLKDLLINKK